MKLMKKLLGLSLVLASVVALAACTEKDPEQQQNAPDTYTMYSYSTGLATNWNPHTWENNSDSAFLSYIESPLVDLSIKNSATGEYQWVYEMATEIKDVTEDHTADLVKYGSTLPSGVTDAAAVESGYVYEIKLNPNAKWENGEVINADTYVYSMQQLLDSKMRNYRANNYYSGESAIAGAYEYFNSEAPIYEAVVPAYGDGETPDYSYDIENNKVYISLTRTDMTFAGYSIQEIKDDYGYIYDDYATDPETGEEVQVAFGATYYDELKEQENKFGHVEVTEANMEKVLYVLNQYCGAFKVSIFNEDGSVKVDWFKEFLFKQERFGAKYDWENVGLYKVDDYTIRYVLKTQYDYYYFLTSMTSNWIVNKTLYENCKKWDGDMFTTTYGTSKETTISYGVYKMESFQTDKQVVFVQNENWYGFTKLEDGSLYSETNFEVDGKKVQQYQTTRVVIDVMTPEAAHLAFKKGELSEYSPTASELPGYSTSDQLYQVDETYTMRLFFNTNVDKLQAMDKAGNENSVVMSNVNFRKAFSLAVDRAEWVTTTAGYKPAYSLINSLYFYDVYNDPKSIYRNTDEAMQSICDLYGVSYGEGTPYATLAEAYKAVTGYNLSEAQKLMKQACEELVEAGLYVAGDDIKIKLAWKYGAIDSDDLAQVAKLQEYVNKAVEGSGFGSVTFEAIGNLPNRYNSVANGEFCIGYGAWGGAAFYPFTMFRIYMDPSYASLHESGCWDPSKEELTLTVNGEEVTYTYQVWSQSLSGTGPYAEASNEVKLYILSQLEKKFLELYYCFPLATSTECYLTSYQFSYYTDNYNIMYGFGGMRLMSFNYNDVEWKAYVASQNGQLNYN